jgi:hypothetical protein
MNRLRSFRERTRLDQGRRRRSARSMYVLALAMLLLPLATGCSLDSGRTDGSSEAETSMLASYSTSATIIPGVPGNGSTLTLATSTTAPQTTTTTLLATTTTASDAPTTTLQSVPTTTEPLTPTTVTSLPEGSVLYECTDWSTGLSGWAAAGQWKTVAGMLVTDGSSDSFAVAPVDLGEQRNYAVECEIQILAPDAGTDVYLMARMTNGLGYWAGFNGENERLVVGFGESDIADAHFALDGQWHKYRLELYDNTLKLRFEDAELVRAADNRALEAGTVGIYCGKGQINVRAFRVVAL